ncbi:hypothetical protein ACFU99_19530 [Streptomyces sp. NPDC057654]|uniref:hypothetical protein n=1 Tax=Streptomyces sp. NPDC057654 TaxID=3346196 RepID=UPI0036BB86BB
MHDYTDTTAVVTGASKGLGEAYARELASRGAHFVINDAGMGSVGPFLGRPLEPNLRSVDVNITALIGLAHLLGTGMAERAAAAVARITGNLNRKAGFDDVSDLAPATS